MALSIVTTATAGSASAQTSDADTTLARIIDGIVGPALVSEHIPGAAVAVVRDGRVVFKRGYGLANVEERKAVHVDRTLSDRKATPDGHAGFYGGRCARGAGRLDDAVALLSRAWERNNFRNLAAITSERSMLAATSLTLLSPGCGARSSPGMRVCRCSTPIPTLRRSEADPRFASTRATRP